MNEYNILKDITVDGVPYGSGQTQKFDDEVAAPLIEDGAISLIGPIAEPTPDTDAVDDEGEVPESTE